MLALLTKTCRTCHTEKPITDFNASKVNKDGYVRQCRSCQNAWYRDYYARNSDKFKERRIRDRDINAIRNRLHYDKNKAHRLAYSAEYHRKHKDKVKSYYRAYYQTVEGRAYNLFNSARLRKRDGFTLTLEHVIKGVAAGFCPVTGYPFDLTCNANGRGKRSWSPYAPSIDKIDSSKGYTDDNTRIVSWQYNIMKHTLSDAELLTFCRRIVERNS